ncbi:MAG: molybdopterin-dependent oxidoreductase [Pirellulaceae bacterium]|nr:molybdopterin-dependent oxidoreductase [Pirellulaceae bacterium]
MNSDFLAIHRLVTRRYFIGLGAAGIAAMQSHRLLAANPDDNAGSNARDDATLAQAIDSLESWLTDQDDFQDVSRGNPKPHQLPESKKREVGLTRETWRLEVVSDEKHPSRLRTPLTKSDNTALDFDTLIQLGKTHAVRFAKVMTCLNIGCPLGTGIWEGVPLRTVLWMTQPVQDLRRVFYYGYHNDDPEQMFRSSLPVGRVLEDPFGLPPVILCYKLNGHWLTAERGGPVRIVVPEAYGFKSIKWLSHIVLSNIPHANDTYGEKNNDVDSPLKTFCNLFPLDKQWKANTPIPLTGWAQVGISGLKKVQVWIRDENDPVSEDDRDRIKPPYYQNAPWRDAQILDPPQDWGGGIRDGQIPQSTLGFDDRGKPKNWPMRLTKAHWAMLHPGLPPGQYTIRCRTVDANHAAQPMPRPFRKSGHAAIQSYRITVT